MANINVSVTNTFDEWRIKTNDLADAVGDVALFPISIDGVQYNDLLSSLQEITQNANAINSIDTQVIAINTAINNNADDITAMDILVTGHTSLLQLYSQAHADLDNDKLDLAGGTMTGTLESSVGVDQVIMSWDNAGFLRRMTTQGGIIMSSDSSMVLHAGDHHNDYEADLGIDNVSSAENLWLTSDGSVKILTGYQSGIGTAKTITFDATGTVTADAFVGDGSGLTNTVAVYNLAGTQLN